VLGGGLAVENRCAGVSMTIGGGGRVEDYRI
jgi:hypothetical protein